jgi:hypothetical protein
MLACMLPTTIGVTANSNTTAAIATAPKVILVLEFSVFISTFFSYKYNVIYSTNVLRWLTL